MKTFGRRTIAVILSVIMTLSCFTGLSFSAIGLGINKNKDFGYLVFSGIIIITSYKGEDEDVVIPAEINGNIVGCINSDVFSGCASVKSITIPSSVQILDYAFRNCSFLKSINVSEDNETYQSIDGVLFDKSLTEIIAYPCGRVGEYKIPDGVTKIENYAFYGCTGLTSITIPDGVKSIGESAFEGCTGLTSITISDGVEKISNSALKNCTGLTNITIPGSVKTIGELYYDISSLSGHAFSGCTGLTNVLISDGVKVIGDNAFFGCVGLTNVIIPNSVTYIGDGAFCGCTGITNVTLSDNCTIDRYAFIGCDNLVKIRIPIGVSLSNLQVFNDGITIMGFPNSSATEYVKYNEAKFLDISSCEHTETEIKYEKAACDANGYSGDIFCVGCNKLIEKGVEIAKRGHHLEEIINGTPATCTKKGLTDGIKCSDCGEIIKKQEEIPAFGGHKFSKGLCLNCGAIDSDYKLVLSEQIKIDNDTKTAVFSLPKTSGMKVSEFKKQFDGEISIDIDDNSLVANGTKFKFGDNEFTVIVKGDVQADGKITASDARMVLRIAARLESVDADAFSAADINGDWKVTPSEARKVLRFVARLENSIA